MYFRGSGETMRKSGTDGAPKKSDCIKVRETENGKIKNNN